MHVYVWVSDINECKETKDICSGGVCSNLPGSHRCTCVGGLIPSVDSKQCLGKVIGLIIEFMYKSIFKMKCKNCFVIMSVALNVNIF
jgi:hypothetical protein